MPGSKNYFLEPGIFLEKFSYKGLHGKSKIAGSLFILPALLFFVVFIGISILRTFWISFQNWDAISPATPAGISNYTAMLHDSVFKHALYNTILITIITTLLQTILPLLIAVLIDIGWGKFGTIVRTLLFIPGILSFVIIGTLWRLILDPNFGQLNSLLSSAGLDTWRQAWLGNPNIVIWSIISISLWQSLGLYVVIFFAGLQTIDPTLYEAAEVDGVSSFQRFKFVTLPMMRIITLLVITLNLLNGFKMFDAVYTMTRGGPVNASQVLGTYMLKTTFATAGFPAFGYGAAISIVILGLCGMAMLLQLFLGRKSYD
jgi:ABC-type sugar transport system permease subunit